MSTLSRRTLLGTGLGTEPDELSLLFALRSAGHGHSPTATHAPGSLSVLGPSVRRPRGRVHWAGAETATYWSGHVDGAVSSGQRAAAEVVGRL